MGKTRLFRIQIYLKTQNFIPVSGAYIFINPQAIWWNNYVDSQVHFFVNLKGITDGYEL